MLLLKQCYPVLIFILYVTSVEMIPSSNNYSFHFCDKTSFDVFTWIKMLIQFPNQNKNLIAEQFQNSFQDLKPEIKAGFLAVQK